MTDFYNLDSILSEEERAVRDTVRSFVDEKVLPLIGDCYIEGRFPKELIPEMANLGMFGANLPEEYGCAGLNNVDRNLEPVLHVPGATFVGLNTSHGVTWRTLTWNVRDISIIGDIHKHQLTEAKKIFEKAAPRDARVIVMHHNPVRGELSQRHGLKNTQKILGAFAEMGVDLVCCGHDHQESVHYIEHTRKGTVISTAGTVSNRSRGGRPSSVNTIEIGLETIDVFTHVWSKEQRTFVQGPHKCFKRSEYVAPE